MPKPLIALVADPAGGASGHAAAPGCPLAFAGGRHAWRVARLTPAVEPSPVSDRSLKVAL